MTKEYGNRRSSRSRGGASNQFLVMTLTFLVGYLTASFFDIETLSHWINSQVVAHQEIKKEPAKHQAQNSAIPPKPKFEFYTLLTNEKVPNSQPNANTAAPSPTATNPAVATPSSASITTPNVKTASVNVANAATSAAAQVKNNSSKIQHSLGVNKNATVRSNATIEKGKFLVQVASFKARKDAEQMKGTLILKGFSVYIIPVSHALKGNWFRVVVGPYPNRSLAQQAQIALAKNERLHGMVTAGG
ncbi:Sporulation domain-containing protein [Legionella wadsworthii]|uniref:Sporulation domain-containing protein n=1 Tax=Legionella wadsworthii TaxID=28088 RepID=A0A378M0Y5_9GAMM|nr:SPOR domain-containing protein [Legionella wadsworthii]STY30027.1 Sporulation domain-containing protein [Legionella wadsworthii]